MKDRMNVRMTGSNGAIADVREHLSGDFGVLLTFPDGSMRGAGSAYFTLGEALLAAAAWMEQQLSPATEDITG